MSDPRDESDETQNQSVSALAWFLTGALIGATAAILYAPKTGKQTRRYISNKTQQGKDAVTGAGQEIADSSRELFERGRKLVEDAADLFDRGRKLVKG
jgi:gas vesicle protein